MGSERPTLDDWLRGDVPRQTREETRRAHVERTRVREKRFAEHLYSKFARSDLYRRLLSRG